MNFKETDKDFSGKTYLKSVLCNVQFLRIGPRKLDLYDQLKACQITVITFRRNLVQMKKMATAWTTKSTK